MSFEWCASTGFSLVPSTLSDTHRRGVEPLNRCYHAIMHFGRKSAEVFLRSAFEEDAIHVYLPLRLAR
jgi:hypothetical protein